jgi:hypothetical protein
MKNILKISWFCHRYRPGNMGRLCYLAQPSGSWSWCFSRKALPVARQVWRAFCRPGANFIAFWRGRGTSLIDGCVFLPVDNAGKGHWRSVAVQVGLKAENCHGAELLLLAVARIRVRGWALILASDSVSCKKHDKQLTHIVRVSISGQF